MRKRILSACMAICMLLTLAPVALAEDSDPATELPTVENGVITLTGDIKPTAQLTIDTDGVTLDGQGRTIQAVGESWSGQNADKHLLLITGKNVTIKNVTLDSNDLACGVEVYCATGVKFEDVTITNSENAGLLVNASEVTVTGTLTMENNKWGGVNVGWGSSLSSPTSCSFNAADATLVGVDSIYTDSSDVTNAGNDGSKFTITLPETGWAKTTLEGKNKIYAPSVAKRGDTEYASIAEAIKAENSDSTITLLKDTKENVTISKGKTVTLDLNNKTLTAQVLCEGALTVKDSTAAAAPQVTDKTKGTVAYQSGKITSDVTTLKAQNGGTVTVESGIIESTRNIAVYAEGNTVLNGDPTVSTMTVNGGYIKAQEFAASAQGNGAVLHIGGGVFTAADNAVIAGNGTKNTTEDLGGTTIAITDGTFIGNITSKGYIACGVYHPQRGALTISGGNFYVNNGVGVLMRAGTAKITGGTITTTGTSTGNVGDSTVLQNSYGVIYDLTSKYPGLSDEDQVTISDNATVITNDTDKTLEVLSPDTNDRLVVSGGTFSHDPTAYLEAGKIALLENTRYVVGEKSAIAAEVVPETPKVETDASIPESVKTAVEEAAQKAEVNELAAVANTVANNNQIGKDDGKTALKDAGIIQSDDSTTDVTIVVQPYLQIKAADCETVEESGSTVVTALTLDITPMYRTVATTANVSNGKVIVKDEAGTGETANAVILNDKNTLPVGDNTPLTMTLTLPSNFQVTSGTTIYVQHVKDGVTYVYEAETNTNNNVTTITFTNPHGFSPFTITVETPAAKIGTIGYTSLQAAVDNVKSGETITLLKAGETATVDRTVSFKVDAKGYNYTINLGSYCTNNSTTTNEYNIVYSRPSGSGGGGGSGSSNYTLTFDTNGGSSINRLTKSKGSTVDLTQYTPTRTGYTFDGWYTDKDLTEAVTTLKLTSSTTVYAKWTVKTAESTLPFVDVKTGDWFYDSVQYVYDQGMMTGTASNTFSPNSSTTRGMIVTILYRLEKSPTVSAASAFTDVAAGQWYADAVAWAAANNIVNGTSPTTFAPNAAITREQMAAILYRYAQFKGYDITNTEDLSKFSDQASISEYAVAAMSWANAEGLINGVGTNTLSPKGSATRGQVAAILARFCQNVVK